MRLWAILAQSGQAPLAPERPEGQCETRSPIQVPEVDLDALVAAVIGVQENGATRWVMKAR